MRRVSLKGKKRKSEANASDGESEENGGPSSNAGSVDEVKDTENQNATKGKKRSSRSKGNEKPVNDEAGSSDLENDDKHNENSEKQENGNGKDSKRRKKTGKSKPTTSKDNDESDNEDDEVYEVERIVAHRTIKGRRQFLVRWKGYGEDADTWEQEKDLNCQQLMDDFLADQEINDQAQESSNKKNNASKNKRLKTEEKEKVKTKDEDEEEEKEKEKEEEENEDEDEDEEKADKEEYEVEKILDVHFKKNKDKEFLIRWKGFTSKDDTWEPEKNLNCPKLIASFMSKVDKAKSTDPRELRDNPQHTKRYTLTTMDSGRRVSRRNIGKQSRTTYHQCDE